MSKNAPVVDLPLGLKSILYRSHINDSEQRFTTKEELSKNWHKNTSTQDNTDIYEIWRRKWLSSKLDSKQGLDSVTEIFRDREENKLRALKRDTDEPSQPLRPITKSNNLDIMND